MVRKPASASFNHPCPSVRHPCQLSLIPRAKLTADVVTYCKDGGSTVYTCFLDAEARLHGVQCDVTDYESVKEAMVESLQHLGRIDVLVNAAGIVEDNLLLRTSKQSMTSQINTNLLGTMYTCQVALRTMIKQREGAIINIGSVVGSHGAVGQSSYAASKSGLLGFTKSLAQEVASKNITANVVSPGYINTTMTSHLNQSAIVDNIPLGRMGTSEEVAQLVYFLSQARYITGQVLHIDGGLST